MGPSRKSKASQPSFTRTLVVDNGGYTIKAGFVGAAPATAADGSAEHTADDGQQEPRVIPNCIARDRSRRVYVGSELERCRDFSEMQFRRPVEKGFIVSWEAEREIWSREFFDPKAPLRCDPAETRLLLAEHSNGLPALQSNCDQIVFEEFQFASYARTLGPCDL